LRDQGIELQMSSNIDEFIKERLCGYCGPEREEFVNHVKELGKTYVILDFVELLCRDKQDRLFSEIDVEDGELPRVEVKRIPNGRYCIVTTYWSPRSINVELVSEAMIEYCEEFIDFESFICFVNDKYKSVYEKEGMDIDDDMIDDLMAKIKTSWDTFFFGDNLIVRECQHNFGKRPILNYEYAKFINKREECNQLHQQIASLQADLELVKSERDHAINYGMMLDEQNQK